MAHFSPMAYHLWKRQS